MDRRTFLVNTALGSFVLDGCGDSGGTSAPAPTPPAPPSERATGWTQMPVPTYTNIPPVTAGNFPYDATFPTFDLSDATFLAQLGWPNFLPAPGDQGQQGSCTAWAVGYAAATGVLRSTGIALNSPISPSDLYAKILRRQGLGCAQGTSIHIGMDVLVQEGVMTLANAPYSDRSCGANQSSPQYFIDGYSRISPADVYSMRGSIQSLQPVSFGILVNNAFQTLSSSNDVFFPDGTGGGHALSVIGYDDQRQQYKVINSWGSGWGNRGFFWIPYSSFAQYALDVCIPFSRIARTNQMLSTTNSNGASSVTGQHMNARPYGTGTPGSYAVGVEMGWSRPLALSAAAISVLDPNQNVLFTKSLSVSQIASGLRFGAALPDGAATYTYVRSSVTGTDESNNQVTLSTLARPYQR